MKDKALKNFAAFQEMARIVAAEMHKNPERVKRKELALDVAAQVGGFVVRCSSCGELTEVENPCCPNGVTDECA